ncbi:MAG: hypothetical protein NTZ05_05875, partial [Chloroflexi bacterium]|nr:hypothetical protein [Chloroflexota bacterium]
ERITRIYQGGVRLLYTVPGQLALAALAAAGAVAFIATSERSAALVGELGPGALLFLIPAGLIALLVHEAGHAFTTKAYGYEVLRVGVGWYWFGPIAFVDTSDLWLAGRWPRIAASLAGPYAEALVGSCAALGAAAATGFWSAALWQMALTCYASALINLNPLLEFDGYFVLIDYLDRPNLRPRAMAWLGREFGALVRGQAQLAGNWTYLLYSLGSFVYIAVMGWTMAVLYRLLLQDWLSGVIPAALAAALGWAVAALLMLVMAAGVIGDLRQSYRSKTSR